MHKKLAEIQQMLKPPVEGFGFVLLSILGFIGFLWVVITFVRVVMG